MTAFRREHPCAARKRRISPLGLAGNFLSSRGGLEPSDRKLYPADRDPVRGQKENGEDDCVLLCINAHWEDHEQELPEPPSGMRWRLAFHTACEKPFAPGISLDAGRFVIGARSVAAAVLEPAGS